MATRDRPRALLLGGSANALSAARSLARAGVTVDAIGDGLGSSPVAHSRFRRRWIEPGEGNVQERWLTHLLAAPPAALIPCCDDAVELIADHRAGLADAGHHLPIGDDEVRRSMLDKVATARLASAAGVGCAQVIEVDTFEAMVDAVETIGFPCGLKARHPHHFTRVQGGLKGVTLRGPADLEASGRALVEGAASVIVTEIIPGIDNVYSSYNTFVDDDDTHLFEITKQKLRQFPTDFGLGTAHRTTDLPEVAEVGRRFLHAIGLRDFGNVEFRRDARDGELKLIECNVRLTAANALLTSAGCDVATIVYRRAIGEPVEPVTGFREGMVMMHALRDTRAFLSYRRQGVLGTREWIGSYLAPHSPPLFSISDPAPSLRALARHSRRARPLGRAADLVGRGRR